MSDAYRPEHGTAAWRACITFLARPDARLTARELARELLVPTNTLTRELHRAIAQGAIKREHNAHGTNVYAAGPKLAAAIIEDALPAPHAPPRGSSGE